MKKHCFKQHLERTVDEHDSLALRLKKAGEAAVNGLPVEFLNQMQLRDLITQRAIRIIADLWVKLSKERLAYGIDRWKYFNTMAREFSLQLSLQDHAKRRGIVKLRNIAAQIMRHAETKALDMWKTMVTYQKKIENESAAVILQACARRFLGRCKYNIMVLHHRNEAARRIQSWRRMLEAKNLFADLVFKRKKHVASIVLQLFFKRIIVGYKVKRRIAETIESLRRIDAATLIASTYQIYRSRLHLFSLRQLKFRITCSIKIQAFARSIFSKKRTEIIKAEIYMAAVDACNSAVEDANQQLAAITLAHSYHLYRERVIQQTALETALESMLMAEQHVAALTIQETFREHQVYQLVHNTLCRDLDLVILKASVQLQCFSRTVSAQSTALEMRLEKRAQRIAAVKLQTMRRGQLAREQFRTKRKDIQLLVSKIEGMHFRKMRRHMRQRVLARYQDIRQMALSAGFTAFIAGCRGFMRERELEVMRKAVAFMLQQLVTRSWNSWLDYSLAAKEKKQKLRAAVNFMRMKLTAMSLRHWHERCEESRLRKQKLVVVFLNCVDSHCLNSSRQKRMVVAANELRDYHIKRFGWHDYFIPYIQFRRLQQQQAILFYQGRYIERTPRLVFFHWRDDFMDHQSYKRSLKMGAILKSQEFLATHYFQIMGLHVTLNKEWREKETRAVRHNLIVTKTAVMKGWIWYLEDLKANRKNHKKASKVRIFQLKRYGFKLFSKYHEFKSYKNKLWDRAVLHSSVSLQKIFIYRWFAIAHEELLQRRNLGATRFQNCWRKRKAKLILFHLRVGRQYLNERRQKKQKLLSEQKERTLRALPLFNNDELDWNEITIIYFTAPFAKPANPRFESALALASQNDSNNRWVAYRMDIVHHGIEACIQFGAKGFPSFSILWRGSQRYSGDPMKCIDEVLKNGLSLSSQDELPLEQRIIAAVRHSMAESDNVELQACLVIQKFLKYLKSNILLRRLQQMVKQVYSEYMTVKDIAHWEAKDSYPYEDDERGKYYWNHETTESSWQDPIIPFNDRLLNFFVVTGTGHQIRVEHLKNSSTVNELVQYISKLREVPVSHLRFSIRPESVWYDHTVISGCNNRGIHGKIGVGAKNVQCKEKTTWKPCTVVKVYENESVDVVLEGDSPVTRERVDIRIAELSHDNTTIHDAGIYDVSVLDVVESCDVPEIDEDDIDYAILCSICQEKAAQVRCRTCSKDSLFCNECFLQHHILEPKIHQEAIEEPVQVVEPLSEFDHYLLSRRRTRHQFQPISNELVARSLNSNGSKMRFCADCQLRKVHVHCEGCAESFCNMCFIEYHSKGNKRDHVAKECNNDLGVVITEDVCRSVGWSTRVFEKKNFKKKVENERLKQADRVAAEEIIKEAFEKYDVDNSGALDSNELLNFLRNEICEPVTDREATDAITAMDQDGNGLIEYNELLNWFVALSKEDGRDSKRMRLLRINLQAKRRARLLKNQLHDKVPQEQIANAKKYIQEQAQKWMDKRPLVPGQTKARQIRISDFENYVYLFERYARREYGISSNLTKKCNDEKLKRVKVAFESTFLPAYNDGKLSNVYYRDGELFEHKDEEFRMHWDDVSDCFIYESTSTNETTKINPVLLTKHSEEIRLAFDKYDLDHSDSLEQLEVKKLLEDELCVKLTSQQLDKAMIAMDADGNGHVSFDEFLFWYILGIEIGETSFSGQLAAKKRLRALAEKGHQAGGLVRRATVRIAQESLVKVSAGTATALQSLQSVGRGLHFKLVSEGWKQADVEKAIYKCRDVTPGLKEDEIRNWLAKNAFR